MSQNFTFLYVSYTMIEGEHSYGCDAVVKIKGGLLSYNTIEKLLVNEVIKSEFGDPDDDDIAVDSVNPRRVWEEGEGWGRACELDSWKRIPVDHYQVLKNYIVAHELDAPKENFVTS